MVRVVGKQGALGAGVGGHCSSGMDGSETITRRYPERGSVCSIVGGAFRQEEVRGKKGAAGGGRVIKRLRSHIICKSRIWSTLMFATYCTTA